MLNDCLSTRRQITVNDLPVGRSVDETMRLIKAFQFTVRPTSPHAPSILLHIIFLGQTRRSLPGQLERRIKIDESRS